MKKFDGILLATDLDGTLLRADKSVSEENKRAIEYFKSEGGRFTFITGRTPVAVASLCELLHPNAPIGCMNGAGIYDRDKDELVWSITLPDSVKELAEFVELEFPNTGIEIITKKKIIFHRQNDFTAKHIRDENLPVTEGDFREIREPIVKILFADSSENLDSLSEAVIAHPRAKEFAPIRSDSIYYEILPQGISKATVIKKIPELLGGIITKTVAVGDNDNDAEMLKAADVGFAVSNASASAKASADFITVSNEEHAIAKIIYEL
ncbi:MAG: Cof-type HAD-IIB family hydrolase [Clostridia bacterium]|nr:Cof-type HAD-IIB family hydrolase [Clostridia bacterium]